MIINKRNCFAHFKPRAQIWRIILGATLALSVYGLGMLGLGFAFGYLGFLSAGFENGRNAQDLAILLLTFFPMWLGLALVVRYIHKMPFQTLFGSDLRFNWRHFWIGALTILGFALGYELIWHSINFVFLANDYYAFNTALTFWPSFLWSLPIIVLLFVQIGAEELFFRGYLLQTITARGGGFLIAGGLPSLVFGLGHFDPQFGTNAYYYVLNTTVVGIILCCITLRTGNIGAAFGLHFANNFVVCFLLGIEGHLDAMALFRAEIDLTSPILGLGMLVHTVFLILLYVLWERRFVPKD